MKPIEELININNSIYTATNKQLQNYDISQVKDVSLMAISYNLSYRFISLLKSINIFLELFKKDINLEMQVALLYRPALLDVISFKYITEYYVPGNSLENINKSTERMGIYFIDNLKRYKYEIEKFSKMKLIEDKQCNIALNYIREVEGKVNNEYKDIDITKNNHSSLIKMFNKLPKTDIIKIAYYNYSYYSKYEHFGILTTLMQNPDIDSKEDKIFRMYQSTLVILKSIISALRYIEKDISELMEIKSKFFISKERK